MRLSCICLALEVPTDLCKTTTGGTPPPPVCSFFLYFARFFSVLLRASARMFVRQPQGDPP